MDVPFAFPSDLQCLDTRNMNKGFHDKNNYKKTKEDQKMYMDLRTHYKEMMHLRKVIEGLKFRDKFVEWDSGRYSRLLKYMIQNPEIGRYRNQKLCLLGMVNVPKTFPKDKKEGNAALIRDSHIFRFATRFTMTKCVRESLTSHPDQGNQQNKTFFDPELQGMNLREHLEKQETRTMGSLTSKLEGAKEINRMKKEEKEDKALGLAQQYRLRNINSFELKDLMRHEYLQEKNYDTSVQVKGIVPVFNKENKTFENQAKEQAIYTNKGTLAEAKQFYNRKEHNFGGEDYQPGKKVEGYDSLKVERGIQKTL